MSMDIEGGGGFRVFEPGNGTRYVVALMGVPVAARTGLHLSPGTVLVSVWPGERQSACGFFRVDAGYLAASYVAEKLHLDSCEDAIAIANVLGPLLDRPAPVYRVRPIAERLEDPWGMGLPTTRAAS